MKRKTLVVVIALLIASIAPIGASAIPEKIEQEEISTENKQLNGENVESHIGTTEKDGGLTIERVLLEDDLEEYKEETEDVNDSEASENLLDALGFSEDTIETMPIEDKSGVLEAQELTVTEQCFFLSAEEETSEPIQISKDDMEEYRDWEETRAIDINAKKTTSNIARKMVIDKRDPKGFGIGATFSIHLLSTREFNNTYSVRAYFDIAGDHGWYFTDVIGLGTTLTKNAGTYETYYQYKVGAEWKSMPKKGDLNLSTAGASQAYNVTVSSGTAQKQAKIGFQAYGTNAGGEYYAIAQYYQGKFNPTSFAISFVPKLSAVVASVSSVPDGASRTKLMTESNGYHPKAAGWYTYTNNQYRYATSAGNFKNYGWLNTGGKYYYFDNYIMKRGWIKEGATYFYMRTAKNKPTEGPDGSMVTAWAKCGWSGGTSWFYFNPNGDMKTGWHFTSPYWYYLNPTNGDMATGWKSIGGKWYYLRKLGDISSMGGKEGAMLASGTWKIGSKKYTFNKDGVCTTPNGF